MPLAITLPKLISPYVGRDGKCLVSSTKGDSFTKANCVMKGKVDLEEKFPNHNAWEMKSSWFDQLTILRMSSLFYTKKELIILSLTASSYSGLVDSD